MRGRIPALCAAGIIVIMVAKSEGASFRGLGFLESGKGTFSRALGISPDGEAVAGEARFDNGKQAIRWTASEGMVALGGYFSSALDASAQGAAICGTKLLNREYMGFIWTEDEGMKSLGFLGNTIESRARAISADGKIVAGTSDDTAFRWTKESGMQSIGTLGGDSSFGNGISDNGAIIVGLATDKRNGVYPFRWTEEEGMVSLGSLSDDERPQGYQSATDVTEDGRFIVGVSGNRVGRPEAFLWTADTGIKGLGFLHSEGEGGSFAIGVARDGSVVVGREWYRDGNATIELATEWDETHGIRPLRDVLVSDYGLDLAGWELTSANGISSDGTRIVGDGINPDGQREGWIATIPEPGTGVLMLGALLMLRRR